MKVKVKIFGLIFYFMQVIGSMFPRDLETFQGWEYGAEAPKV